MSRASLLAPLALIGALLVTSAVTADEKIDDSATPRLICISFMKTGDAASGQIESAFLGKMRTDYATQNVLFLQADLSTPATTHQARLLLNALGGHEVWMKNSKKPGTVVLVDGEYGDIRATLTGASKEADAKKAFEAAMKPQEESDEPGDKDEGGDEEDK